MPVAPNNKRLSVTLKRTTLAKIEFDAIKNDTTLSMIAAAIIEHHYAPEEKENDAKPEQ